MNELEKAKLLAAAHKLILSEVAKLRKEILEEATYPVLPEQDHVVVEGPAGKDGRDGLQGSKGEPGRDGTSITETRLENGNLIISLSTGDEYDIGNIIGEQGPPGEDGIQGPIGEQGIPGLKGDKGDKGDRGDKGDQGIPGVDGRDGKDGKDGTTGKDGKPGRDGKDGKDGEQGVQGIPGVKGPRGDRGEQGKQGIPGPTGPIGPAGPKGDKGDAGEKGDKGDQGDTPDITPFQEKLLKDLKDYKSQISKQVTKSLKLTGGGSSGGGEVRLLRLDDVDTRNLANNAFIKYDANTGKLVFTAIAPGGGVSNFSELTGTLSASQIPQNTINVSKFVNDSNYANTSQLTRYLEVANSASFISGSLNGYLQVANANISLATKASNTYVNQQLQTKVSTIIAGTNINVSGNSTVVTISSNNATISSSDSLKLRFNNNTGETYKLVVLDSNANTIPASCKTLAHANRVLGIINGSGDTVVSGLITNSGWSWSPEQVLYLGDNGDITTTSAVDGSVFSLPIGYAISATRVFVKLGTPVLV